MKLILNLVAGVINSSWSALLGLLMIPFYLKYMGIESYGLIGFFITMQTVISLLDMGMAPTINREVARNLAEGNLIHSGKILQTFAFIYWTMAILIVMGLAGISPLISYYWLDNKTLSQEKIMYIVVLMGIVIGCRWPMGAYQAVLNGAQKIALYSKINIAVVTLGSIGTVLVLKFISSTIEAFFIWQALVGLAYTLLIRSVAWTVIGEKTTNRIHLTFLKQCIKLSMGIGFLSLAGVFLTQIDKLILIKVLSLEVYGEYMLGTVVASGLYLLIVPIFNVIYPKFTTLVAQDRQSDLVDAYRVAGRGMAALIFPTAMVLILLAHTLIFLWTGNANLASNIAPLAKILLIAYALHGLMYIPYALMLANGEIKSIFIVYVVLILCITPITIILSLANGAFGGALSQLILFICYFFLGIWITHKKYLKGYGLKWVIKDLFPPFGISTFIGVVSYFIFFKNLSNPYLILLFGFIVWIASLSASIYTSKTLSLIISKILRKYLIKRNLHVSKY